MSYAKKKKIVRDAVGGNVGTFSWGTQSPVAQKPNYRYTVMPTAEEIRREQEIKAKMANVPELGMKAGVPAISPQRSLEPAKAKAGVPTKTLPPQASAQARASVLKNAIKNIPAQPKIQPLRGKPKKFPLPGRRNRFV